MLQSEIVIVRHYAFRVDVLRDTRHIVLALIHSRIDVRIWTDTCKLIALTLKRLIGQFHSSRHQQSVDFDKLGFKWYKSIIIKDCC